MDSRRQFLGKMTGLAGALAAPAQRVLGANERVRVAVIGYGARGAELALQVQSCPNTELAAVADIYARRLEDAKRAAPGVQVSADYRGFLDDPSIDAVIVATPQHLHSEHFVASLDAGKHVYQERTMAFTVDHAKRMRAAFRNAPGRTVQIGHQACSSGHVADAADFLAQGAVGRVTAIQMHMYRNTPRGKPQWVRPVYPDMTLAAVVWESFLGEAPPRPFDAYRYVNWRLFHEYSGGNVHESMSQQLAFWYKVLNLQIPYSATMTGGVYLWNDGRDTPDTMSVSLQQPEAMLITWNSGFGNSQPGVAEAVLGTDGTILRGQQIRYVPQKVNRPDLAEEAGRTPTAPNAHLRNFIDCIRLSREPECPFEIGWRVSIAAHMAVESYLQQRTVYWNAETEQLV